jgi:hypothetical protein
MNRYLAISLVIVSSLTVACDKVPKNAQSDGSSQQSQAQSTDNSKSEQAPPINTTKQSPPSADKPNSSIPYSEYVEIKSGDTLMYLYTAISGVPPDYEKIAELISTDFRSTQDSFKRQDIIKALTPRISDEIKKASSTRYISWISNDLYTIDKYDFANKAFPINADHWDGNSLRYLRNNSYVKIKFIADGPLQKFAVTNESDARKIESLVSTQYKDLALKTYAFVQDADLNERSIKAVVTKFELLDKQGRVLASVAN